MNKQLFFLTKFDYKKCFKRHSLKMLLTFTFLISLSLNAQIDYYGVITGTGTSDNGLAPQALDRCDRSVWLITAAEMAASGFVSGDVISSIGFNYLVGADVPASGTLKVYFSNTTSATNALSTAWTTAITGMTMVSSSTITIPAAAGTVDYPFSGGSAFSYTGGGLYIAMDYQNLTGTVSNVANTALCSTTLTNGLIGVRTTTTTLPTTLTASTFRPETRLGKIVPSYTTPPVASNQTFCNQATVANLSATGTNIKWYSALNGGSELPMSTPLISGTYYASQTLNSVESTRTAVAVLINPKTTPTFTQVAAVCSGATIAALPTTSTNGITGTWSPAINNLATTTYTFTPTTGLCANTAIMTITVNTKTTPTFTQVAAVCSGATIAALPTTSTNGITGTWSPAINNLATTTYTFAPTDAVCNNSKTMTITVNTKTTPTFTQVAAVCSGATIAALPTTSTNNVTGSWSPAINNSATSTYTFTPTTGLCASKATMNITVNQAPLPISITPISSTICIGSSKNLNASGGGSTNISSANFSSGSILLPIPDNDGIGVANSISVNSIPAGATITDVSVNFNINHTYDSDLIINIKAPNGKVLNLVDKEGNDGANFINTIVGSSSVNSLSNFSAPFTGSYKADASSIVGAADNVPSVLLFSDLYNTPNGNWTLSVLDDSEMDFGTIVNWNITIYYSLAPNYIWTTTSSGLNIYSGSSVIASPLSNQTYTVTSTINGCSKSATATVNVNPINTLNLSSMSGTNLQTVCLNNAINSISYVTTGATGIGVTSGLPTGVAAIWANNTLTISGTPTTSGTFNYSIPLTGGCGSINAIGTIIVNPNLPTSVSIESTSTTICSGTSTTFTASPTNGGTSPIYQWKINGIAISEQTAPTFTSTTLTNNDAVSVVMTSSDTCVLGSPTTSNSITMTVNPNLPASVSIESTATTICLGSSVSFTASPTNGGTSPTYQWKVNGIPISGETAPTFTATTLSNTDAVSVVMTSLASCVYGSPANSNSIIILVTPKTTPTFTEVPAVCSGATIEALPTTSTNGVIGTWSPGVNNTSTTTYTFTPTDAACNNGTSMSIAVMPITTPTFNQVASVCSGATIAALPSTSTNGITGTWSPEINNLETTTYTFTPTDAVCNNVTTMTITVNPNPTPTVAPQTFCTAATVANLVASGTDVNWYASANDGAVLPTTTALTTGTYYASQTTNGCESTRTAVTVSINDAQISASAITVCSGTPVTITASTNSAGTSTLPTNLQNGLVGYWPFNGNANDASGNGNNGTVNGAILTTDRFGNSNGAYSFDNLSDVISMTNISPSLNNYSKTISVWLKFPNQYHYSSLALVKNGTAYSTGFDLAIDQNNSAYGDNNYLVVFLAGNGGAITFISNQSELGNWANLVAIYNGSEIKLYLNSNLKASQPYTGNLNCTDSNIYFGLWDNPSAPEAVSRQLDDIAIYNRALFPSEITQLYTQGQATYLWSTGETSATINPTPTATTTYWCDITINGVTCRKEMTITVNPNNTVSESSAQTLCIHSALTPVTHSTTGASGIGIATGLPNGVTASWENNTITISGNPTESGTFNYSIPLVGGCGSVNAIGTIIVNQGSAACSSKVNLKVNFEGYYNLDSHSMIPVKLNQGVGLSETEVDAITVELRDAVNGNLVASEIATLHTDGTALAAYTSAPNGLFYLVIKYKNTIETWSARPQMVGDIPLNYDFTTSVSQAYGGNLIEVEPGVFAVYSGDINQDSNIDNIDYSLWEEDANDFIYGYYPTDLNGDGNVDNIDYSIWEKNSNEFIYSIKPF